MSDTNAIAEAVDGFLPDPRRLRIQRDAALVADLALGGFEGREYEVFEDRLIRDSMPILRGMLRSGTFITLATQKFEKAGIPFFVSRENKQLLHSSDAERDDIIIDVLMIARVAFRTKALVGGGWNPEFGGSKGPCCLMTYFIGRCMWEFRRVYLRWARERERIARVEASLLDPEVFFRLLTALPHHGEPETILFSTALMDLLDAQPAETRAVVRLTCEGYGDGEIAERLKSKIGAVRTRRYRFRRVLYQAASERKIWIPAQLHVNGVREQQRSAV
ncbi:hypothetical protein ACFUV1_12140 [Streptomyces griseoincarnatus]